MPIEVRTFDGDPGDYARAAFVAFAESIPDSEVEHWSRLIEPDRSLAAYDGDRVIGTASIVSFDLTVPGTTMAAAGVTVVGVHPTHRRRGILRRMMERQLNDVHERGESVAVLWASDAGIYQRFGYGLASLHAGIKVERHHNEFRAPHEPTGSLRLIAEDEAKATLPAIHEAARPGRVGFFSRSPAYWDAWIFAYPEAWRQGRGDPFHVIHEYDGAADGYVRYAVRSGEKNELSVLDMIAATPAAHLDLWRFLLDVDLMHRVESWNVAVDDPLLLAVAQPRRLEMTIGDALWLRIVDVAGALGARRYRADGRLVLDLTDGLLAWNAGRWSLDVADGIARLEPSTEVADIALDTTDLAATYLGGITFAQLAAARRIVEHAPGAIDRADRLFGTDRAPWAPSVF